MITRPELIQGLFFKKDSELYLSLKIAATLERDYKEYLRPISNWPMLLPRTYQLMIRFFDGTQEIADSKLELTTNLYGEIKITTLLPNNKISSLKIYEVGSDPGISFYIGLYQINEITPKTKLIITDFDKTLIKTKYKTTSEIIRALTNRLTIFDRIESTYHKIKNEMQEKTTTLVLLSASPHFYAKPIKDWLKVNWLGEAAIILKDAREVLFHYKSNLSFKDLRLQGFYKLNALLDLVNLIGLPDEISLYGDAEESDPQIYSIFAEICKGNNAYSLMNLINNERSFQLTLKQKVIIREKIEELIKRRAIQKTNICITIKQRGDEL